MSNHPGILPTDGELMILQVLWDHGPCTVRRVHETLGDEGSRGVRYTTTLKIMQNMFEKHLVARDERRLAHVYQAAVEREPVQRRLLKQFVGRTFSGSVGKLVLQALAAGEVSPAELREIRKLLSRAAKGEKP